MPRPADPRKQQQWLQRILRWRGSHLSVRDYCDRLQVSEASFYAWKRTLQRRGLLADTASSGARAPRAGALANAPLFLPVTVPVADTTSGRIDLVLPDGWTVRVTAGFDAATLRQLLAVLQERPC
jgi:hypothetical protein